MCASFEFKYNPNVLVNSVVKKQQGTCECCGKEVSCYIPRMYCRKSVDCICLSCVSSGEAARKFDGTFVQQADYIDDELKRDELFRRTPGYSSWQGENWKACCDDYCAFVGDTSYTELVELGLLEEVLASFNELEVAEVVKIQKEGPISGYLFRCLHCGRHYLRVDCQ